MDSPPVTHIDYPGTATSIEFVTDWLMTKAMEDCDLDELFQGCCLRLRATGIPITRAHLTLSTLRHLYRNATLSWYEDNAAETEHFPRQKSYVAWASL